MVTATSYRASVYKTLRRLMVASTKHSLSNRLTAWSVHVYTGLGLPLMYLATQELLTNSTADHRDPRMFFLWMWLSIIVDSTDPIGPGEGLFNVAFYSNCRRALRPNGLLIQQSESPLIHRQLHLDMRQAMGDAGFVDRHPVLFPQPCYPSGWWSGTMAATGLDLTSFRSIDVTPLKTQYYNAATHRAALAIPQAWIGAAGDNS